MERLPVGVGVVLGWAEVPERDSHMSWYLYGKARAHTHTHKGMVGEMCVFGAQDNAN